MTCTKSKSQQNEIDNKMKPTSENTCTKVKHPCKYCLQSVNRRNGLQCQGACKKWAHYKCLNYTPGKIADIKSGVIKVTCPCPDCVTSKPKEYVVNPPFTCSNQKCPANLRPKCTEKTCPTNAPKNPKCPNLCPPPDDEEEKDPCLSPPPKPAPPPSPPKPLCIPKPPPPAGNRHPLYKCPSGSQSLSSGSDSGAKVRTSTSDNCLTSKKRASMMAALQEMCCTMGRLTSQIKDLMGKMVS